MRPAKNTEAAVGSVISSIQAKRSLLEEESRLSSEEALAYLMKRNSRKYMTERNMKYYEEEKEPEMAAHENLMWAES